MFFYFSDLASIFCCGDWGGGGLAMKLGSNSVLLLWTLNGVPRGNTTQDSNL